jgi:hypothetical protein
MVGCVDAGASECVSQCAGIIIVVQAMPMTEEFVGSDPESFVMVAAQAPVCRGGREALLRYTMYVVS